jgi:hypothetical protein
VFFAKSKKHLTVLRRDYYTYFRIP